MNEIFRSALDKFVTVYLDDILVFSKDPAQHERHLRWVFSKLREHGLHAKRRKCDFALRQLEYLGHIITPEGIRVHPGKTSAIDKLAQPTCKKELQMFLGMCNYYVKFVRDYAHTAAPLYELLRKDVHWGWTAARQHAFDALKRALCDAPVLTMPDFTRPFIIETDASQVAIGG